MKTLYSAAALLLTALTVFAQTQSRDIRRIRLLPRETYGDAVYQKNTRLPVAVGSFERKMQGDVSFPPEFSAGQAPRGGGGAPSQNDGILTNLRDVPMFNGPDTRRVKKPINGREGGAYYSFFRRTHDWNYGSDISLAQGHLQTGGGGANYGLLTNIGDVPLDSVNRDTPSAKTLAAYKRAKEEPDARLEHRRFEKGAEIDGLTVKIRVPLKRNSTYLLRSIDYESSDVLVAFRVMEIDSDGSAIIDWKLLQRFRTPHLRKY